VPNLRGTNEASQHLCVICYYDSRKEVQPSYRQARSELDSSWILPSIIFLSRAKNYPANTPSKQEKTSRVTWPSCLEARSTSGASAMLTVHGGRQRVPPREIASDWCIERSRARNRTRWRCKISCREAHTHTHTHTYMHIPTNAHTGLAQNGLNATVRFDVQFYITFKFHRSGKMAKSMRRWSGTRWTCWPWGPSRSCRAVSAHDSKRLQRLILVVLSFVQDWASKFLTTSKSIVSQNVHAGENEGCNPNSGGSAWQTACRGCIASNWGQVLQSCAIGSWVVRVPARADRIGRRAYISIGCFGACPRRIHVRNFRNNAISR